MPSRAFIVFNLTKDSATPWKQFVLMPSRAFIVFNPYFWAFNILPFPFCFYKLLWQAESISLRSCL